MIADRDDLTILRGNDGVPIVGRASEAAALDPSSGRVKNAAGLKEFIFFERSGDWRIWRDTGLSFERRSVSDNGPAIEVLRGSELFSHGQFVFDHVEDVWFDPTDNGRVLVQTSRTVEVLRDGAESPRLQVVATGASRRTVLAGRTLGGPSVRSAGSVLGDSSGDTHAWRCRMDGREWVLTTNGPHEPPETASPSQVPQSFLIGERLWIVLPNGLHWIEASDRWREKRMRDGVQPLDAPRSEAASAAGD